MSLIQRNLGAAMMVCLAIGASACSKKEKPEGDKVTAADQGKKKKPAKAKADSKPKVDEALVALGKVVKTEEDFEEAVEQEIVAENLEAEVDKLEKELGPQAE